MQQSQNAAPEIVVLTNIDILSGIIKIRLKYKSKEK